MKLVVQRVSSACVSVQGRQVGQIGNGLLIFLGVAKTDGEREMEWGAKKVAELRIFQDDQDRMNYCVRDVSGSILVISQFTLFGNAERGRRPSFVDAAPPDTARPLYEKFIQCLRELGIHTESGVFASKMRVELVNEGPVTILLDR